MIDNEHETDFTPRTYTEIRQEVEKWFKENIDEELLKELMSRPLTPAQEEMIKRLSSPGYMGARIELPMDFK